jgi:hypothetical protein
MIITPSVRNWHERETETDRQTRSFDRPMLVHENELDVYTNSSEKDNLHLSVSPQLRDRMRLLMRISTMKDTKSIGLIACPSRYLLHILSKTTY